jgi:cardiolipin synthase
LADRLFIISTVIGLAVRGIIPWWLVALVIGRDLVVSLTIPALAGRGYGPLPVHFLGKAATFNLLYAFPLLLLADGTGSVAAVARPIAWAFVWWGVGLYWWAACLYLWQARDLIRAAPENQPMTGTV